MRPTRAASGRLRPRDVRFPAGDNSRTVPTVAISSGGGSKREQNRTSPKKQETSTLTIGGMAWLAHKLCEEGVPSAQLLVYVHQLNSKLQSAPTMEQCAQQVSLLPERAVLVVLELVASGEPHAHIGATLLHFASFHLPLLTTLLVQTQVVRDPSPQPQTQIHFDTHSVYNLMQRKPFFKQGTFRFDTALICSILNDQMRSNSRESEGTSLGNMRPCFTCETVIQLQLQLQFF
mmetsp:Transcript_12190/g.23265  ORF Transcript_12190/g.23265 Transcript_12190/m.23265 type:complete len:233 (+) Transcript_12190:399-1097(+)